MSKRNQNNFVDIKLAANERIDDLQLNGYKIIQNSTKFCFGIDAVLLANYAKVKRTDKVVDLCTGNGVIPFLIAGKSNSQNIIGVEIQEDNVEMANRSIELNELQDRVKIQYGDVKNLSDELENGSTQVVTVNPPYMIANHGIKNEDPSKLIARHEIMCTLDDVIKTSSKLLCDKGRFYMIHKPFRLAEIFSIMLKYRIEPKSMMLVHSKVDKEPSMVLIEGIKGAKSRIRIDRPLIIYNKDGSYTEELLKCYDKTTSV